jgi:seryl-tRNA synthetase
VHFEEPAHSYNALEEMADHIEHLLQKLELPYRKLRLCGGDLGFTSALTYDFEVYSAAQEKWLEVSSVSNFESYQTRRLQVRYNDQDNKKQFVHTLNGSALALPRILACILENNQTKEGIKVPKVVQPLLNFSVISG